MVGFCEYGTELLGYLEGYLFLKRESDLWTSYGPYHNSLCDNNVRVFDVSAAMPTRSSLLRNVSVCCLLFTDVSGEVKQCLVLENRPHMLSRIVGKKVKYVA